MSVTHSLPSKALLAAALLFSFFAGPAFADSPTEQTAHQKHHGGFRLGMCVGQALAAQGIALPSPGAGQADPALKAAIETAKETCHAQFKQARAQSQAGN